jgi:hypothetical protein
VISHVGLSQLQAGDATVAAGYVGAGGTLSAVVVVQPVPVRTTFPARPGAGKKLQLDVGGCQPASIDQAYAGLGSGS